MNQPSRQAPAPDAPSSSHLWADRYEVFEVLGTGAMGTVFDAFDHVLGRPVTITRIHPLGSRQLSAMRLPGITNSYHRPSSARTSTPPWSA